MPSGKTAPAEIVDNKDGTVSVRYVPTETGLHELHIKCDGTHIPGTKIYTMTGGLTNLHLQPAQSRRSSFQSFLEFYISTSAISEAGRCICAFFSCTKTPMNSQGLQTYVQEALENSHKCFFIIALAAKILGISITFWLSERGRQDKKR